MGAPSIGSIPIRSAPQRCEKTTVDQLFQVVNNNCNSAVRRALLTWVQRFSPTLRQEFCRPGPPGAHTRKFTVSQNYFLIKDLQRPWITITRAYRAEKDGRTTIRACDPILHNPLFSQIQRSLLMAHVFVTMRADRKFFSNCAWRATMGGTQRDDMCANLPVARCDGFSGPTGLRL
jgi:hypothetical protein